MKQLRWQLVFSFLLLSLGAFAVDTPPAKIIDFTVNLEKTKVESNQVLQLVIDLEIIPDHYLYLDKTKIVWPDSFEVKSTKLSFSSKDKIFDKFAKKEKEILKNKLSITTVIELPVFNKLGKQEIPIGIRYQACSENYCLLPKTEFRKLEFEVVGGQIVPDTTMLEKERSTFESALEKGLWFTFLFVFFAGFLTSFTPCIFPMIPITLAVIGSRSADSSRWKNFSISLVYVLGIAITYALLGLFAATTGALFGSFMSSPYVVGAIAGILILMALSMFGLFEIKPPQFLTNKLGKAGVSNGYSGSFVAGLIAGVVASPCVGPVLVGILAFVAQTQNAVLGFWLLFTFAMGLGILFLVLGTFSGLIKYLPKSGPWMDLTKFIFGVSMLGLALYFASPLMPRSYVMLLIGLGTIAFGLIFGFLKNESIKMKETQKLLGLIGICVGVLFIFTAGTEYQKENSQLEAPSKMLGWEAFSKTKLKSLKAEGKPIIIDFKADWCAACKELEEKTFSTDEFKQLTSDITLLYVDATDITPEIGELTEEFGVLGLPTVIFIDSTGKVRDELTVTGFEKIENFGKRIRALGQ